VTSIILLPLRLLCGFAALREILSFLVRLAQMFSLRKKPRQALDNGPAGLLASRTYCFTAGVGLAAGLAAAVVVPLVFFTAGFTACFLVCFFTLGVVTAGAALPLAGGVAGVWAANVRGRVANARAMVINVVFIFFLLAGSGF
jgi:hypothetical protein